jgi:hypothetical protein
MKLRRSLYYYHWCHLDGGWKILKVVHTNSMMSLHKRYMDEYPVIPGSPRTEFCIYQEAGCSKCIGFSAGNRKQSIEEGRGSLSYVTTSK